MPFAGGSYLAAAESGGAFTVAHFEAWAIILGVIITAAGIVGAAFRSQSSAQALNNYKTLAESYKETVDQQKGQIDRQEQQILALQDAMSNKDTELAVLGQKIQTLQEVITGRAALEELGQGVSAVRVQVAELLAQAAEGRSAQRAMTAKIDAIAGHVGLEGTK